MPNLNLETIDYRLDYRYDKRTWFISVPSLYSLCSGSQLGSLRRKAGSASATLVASTGVGWVLRAASEDLNTVLRTLRYFSAEE